MTSFGGLVERKNHSAGFAYWTLYKSTVEGNAFGRSDVEDFLYVFSY